MPPENGKRLHCPARAVWTAPVLDKGPAVHALSEKERHLTKGGVVRDGRDKQKAPSHDKLRRPFDTAGYKMATPHRPFSFLSSPCITSITSLIALSDVVGPAQISQSLQELADYVLEKWSWPYCLDTAFEAFLAAILGRSPRDRYPAIDLVRKMIGGHQRASQQFEAWAALADSGRDYRNTLGHDRTPYTVVSWAAAKANLQALVGTGLPVNSDHQKLLTRLIEVGDSVASAGYLQRGYPSTFSAGGGGFSSTPSSLISISGSPPASSYGENSLWERTVVSESCSIPQADESLPLSGFNALLGLETAQAGISLGQSAATAFRLPFERKEAGLERSLDKLLLELPLGPQRTDMTKIVQLVRELRKLRNKIWHSATGAGLQIVYREIAVRQPLSATSRWRDIKSIADAATQTLAAQNRVQGAIVALQGAATASLSNATYTPTSGGASYLSSGRGGPISYAASNLDLSPLSMSSNTLSSAFSDWSSPSLGHGKASAFSTGYDSSLLPPVTSMSNSSNRNAFSRFGGRSRKGSRSAGSTSALPQLSYLSLDDPPTAFPLGGAPLTSGARRRTPSTSMSRTSGNLAVSPTRDAFSAALDAPFGSGLAALPGGRQRRGSTNTGSVSGFSSSSLLGLGFNDPELRPMGTGSGLPPLGSTDSFPSGYPSGVGLGAPYASGSQYAYGDLSAPYSSTSGTGYSSGSQYAYGVYSASYSSTSTTNYPSTPYGSGDYGHGSYNQSSGYSGSRSGWP